MMNRMMRRHHQVKKLSDAEKGLVELVQRNVVEAQQMMSRSQAEFANVMTKLGLDPKGGYSIDKDGVVTKIERPSIEAVAEAQAQAAVQNGAGNIGGASKEGREGPRSID